MSKRAEEAALKAYPEPSLERITTDVYKEARKYYQKGYEQAEKDTIERACEYLFKHYAVNLDEFRKAMEEK